MKEDEERKEGRKIKDGSEGGSEKKAGRKEGKRRK
jgi:hypothetical protein